MIGATSWQDRRAKLLQAACNEIENRVRDGQQIMRTIRLVARKFRFRSLGAGRRLRLSEQRLETLWYLWRGRRDVSIFSLRYRPGIGRIPISGETLQSLAQTRIFGNRSVAAIVKSGEIRSVNGRCVPVRLAYRRLTEQNIPARKLAQVAASRSKLLAQVGRVERLISRQQAKVEKQVRAILS